MSAELRACQGAATNDVRTTEHMCECQYCGIMVREDMTEHPFFGFKAGCQQEWEDREETGPMDLEDELDRLLNKSSGEPK
jgi:hypothetical protein